MAAPTHPAKIPKEEWDRHRDAIMALYLGNSEQPEGIHDNAEGTPSQSLSSVVVTMKEKYGFVISEAQLELQLNKWQFRKNFKPEEWELIFDQLEMIPPHTEYRVNISGCIKSKSSINRARRYAKRRRVAGSSSRREATAASALPHVRIEVRGEDGIWTQARHTTPAVITEVLPQSAVSRFDMPPQTVATYPMNSAIHGAASLELQPFRRDGDVVNIDAGITDLDNLDLELGSFNIVDSDISLDTLDFRFQQPTEIRFRLPSEWLDNPPSRLLTNARSLIEYKLKDKSVYGQVNRESLLRDIYRHVNIGASHALQLMKPINLARWLEMLGSMPSSYSYHEITECDQQQTTVRGLQKTNLSRFLLSAMLYAFSDAIRIPNGMLAKVTIPDDTLVSCVCRYLKDPQVHIETMLAPHVFHAAIWEPQSRVVATMLERNLIDVNYPLKIPRGSIFYSYVNRRYSTMEFLARRRYLGGKFLARDKCMPIEAATMNGDIETIEILLSHGAEVRTDVLFCVWIDYIETVGPEDANLQPKYVTIGHKLIEAGAIVNGELLASLLDEGGAKTPFIQFIASEFRPSVNYTLFRKKLEDLASKTEIGSLDGPLSEYQTHFEQQCKEEIRGIRDSLLRAARIGHLGVFGAVFPHYWHGMDDGVLSAIIETGNKCLIDIVMKRKPNIRPKSWRSCSPFEAAIKTRNKEIIDFFIASGIIDVLQEGSELEDAIIQAAEYGHVELIKMLLSRYPHAEYCEVSDTILGLPEGASRDFLISTLRDAGGCVSIRCCGSLQQASDRRHDTCVGFYLAKDPHAIKEYFWKILAWGDKTIIQGLLSNYDCEFRFEQLPAKIYCTRHESLEMKWSFNDPQEIEFPYDNYGGEIHLLKTLWDLLGDKSKVDLICESRLATTEILVAALLVAVIRQDQGMVSSFIQAGADASDERVWAAAVEHSPGMLPVLSQVSQMPKPVVTRGFGTRILKNAIIKGPVSFEGVSYLIKSRSVDIFDTGVMVTKWGPLQTPLGTAISQCRRFPHFGRDVVVLLLDAGCDPNDIVHFDEEGSQTALLRAVETGNKDLVEFFLGRNAQLDGELSHIVRRTPLQKAAEMGDLEMVQLLISRGANVNARPAVRQGGTAVQLAARSGNCLVATELFNQGASLYMQPSEFGGRWPIQAAAECGHLDMIQLLWNAKSDMFLLQEDLNKKPGFEEKQLRRAMQLATKNAHIGCRSLIEELSGLEHKSPRRRTPSGGTPIYVDWPPPGWSWATFWNRGTTPNTLKYMEVYDQASRGLRGSVMLLKHSLRKPTLLLSLVVALLSIALGTFTQQAVRTVVCKYADNSATASIPNVHTLGNVDSLSDRFLDPNQRMTPISLSFAVKAGILSSLTNPTGNDSVIQATCTTGNCTFTDFGGVTHRSIGFCNRCIDVSSYLTANTTNLVDTPSVFASKHKQSWFLPNGQEVYHEEVIKHSPDGWATYQNTAFFDISTDSLQLNWSEPISDEVFQFLNASTFNILNVSFIGISDVTEGNVLEIPTDPNISSTVCTIYACVKSYHASIDKGKLEETIASTTFLQPYGDELFAHHGPNFVQGPFAFFPTNMIAVESPCNIQGKSYTPANFSLAPDTVTMQRLQVGYGPNGLPVKYEFGCVEKNSTTAVNNTAPPACIYAMEHANWFAGMQGFLRDVLQATCGSWPEFPGTSMCGPSQRRGPNGPDSNTVEMDPFWIEGLASRPSRTTTDISRYMDDFTESLTRKFRIGLNASIEDQLGAPSVRGEAWQTTTCFTVQWEWLLLPVALTALGVVLLVWTLASLACGSEHPEMVWKSSILPLLYHGERVRAVNSAGQTLMDERKVSEQQEWNTQLLELEEMRQDARQVKVVFQG
ncbi:hypothetical protein NUW58_g5425 [Xylaria curta]|uniref:Uncharacterized protein n=1 Tax=Xylaria curta TaxID=42375 RepID=A0ACC1P1N3_9PEZI|nr:hypothetical protein NUW58_g5425 [Xylaria curta]